MHDYPITAHVEGDFSVGGKHFETYLEASAYREWLLAVRAEKAERAREAREDEER